MRIKPNTAPPYFKTGLRKQKERRLVDEKHLAFVRTLPCLACGGAAGTAHHLTVDRFRAGRRAGDDIVVPMTERCHNIHPGSLHMIGEKNFWNALGIDPRPVAAALYEKTGEREPCEKIIAAARRQGEINRARGVRPFPEKERRTFKQET